MKNALLCLLLLSAPTCWAQTARTVHYGEADGLSHRHVTQILQDRDGFIWLSTWNGLDRFDGREFVAFKSRPGDGVAMPSNSFTKIAIDDHDPNIINCRVGKTWFRFSLSDGTFSPTTTAEGKALDHNPGHGVGRTVVDGDTWSFNLLDRQGLSWKAYNGGVDLTIPNQHPISVSRWGERAEVKSLSADSAGRVWVSTREDRRVRIFDHGHVSYLAPDGTLSQKPVSFGSPVYSIYQGRPTGWDVWLGSKPDGLFHLRRDGNRYHVEHFGPEQGLPATDIYDMKMDGHGRMWLASMGGGVVCLDHGRFSALRFGRENMVKRVYILKGDLLVACTTEGLLVADITPGRRITWHLHQREPRREQSLSNNSCTDFAEVGGHWFVATESGGIDEVLNRQPSSQSLSFRHHDTRSGLGSDAILSASPFSMGNGRMGLLAVSGSQLIMLDPETGDSRELSERAFHQQLAFSEAKPLNHGGNWTFGLYDGMATFSSANFAAEKSMMPIVLTAISVENRPADYTVNQTRRIVLQSDERTVAITMAVLDYRDPLNISYAYQIDGDSGWHYLGNHNTVLLTELAPGDYSLRLRATNALGQWNPDVRTLEITVKPKLTETLWFQWAIVLLIVGLVVAALLTRRYISRIKAKQRETLAAYLALLEKNTSPAEPEATPQTDASAKLSAEDDAFMSRVVAFVDAHISDSDITIDDMASAAIASKSSLNRKMKQLVGLTPADFLREARIKHACSLLVGTTSSIADITYNSGFTDPKYFSRVFRHTMGMSPTDYRATHKPTRD